MNKKSFLLLTTRDIYHLSILGSIYRSLAAIDAFMLANLAQKEHINKMPFTLLSIVAILGLIYAVITYFIIIYLWKRKRNPDARFKDFVLYAKTVTIIDLITLSALCLLSGCHASRLYIFFIPILLYAPFFFQTRTALYIIGLYMTTVILVTSILESRHLLPAADSIVHFCVTHRDVIISYMYVPAAIFFILLFSIIMGVLKRRMEYNFMFLTQEKEKLANLQQFLERIIMSFPLGVIIFTGDKISIYNKKIKEILELNDNEKEDTVKEKLDNTNILSFIETLDQTNGGSLTDIPVVVNGKKKFIEISIEKVGEDSTIVIIEDVTEKKQQEQRTMEAEANMLKQDKLATIGQMAAGIAHELNNPIAGINSLAQLLLHRVEKNHEITDSDIDKLKKILANTDRITRLVRNLLQFAKPSAKREKIDVNKIVMEILSLFEYQFRKNDIKIYTKLSDSLPEINFNRTELEEVIVNLIQNAIQFLDKKDRWIKIETGIHEDREIEIIIEDNGKGISADEIDKIFTPFYTTRKEGTGLGLSIISNILEKNNGKIMVTSREGIGSRFVVRIPINGTSTP